MASRAASVRWRVVRSLFEVLYRHPALYWLASTLPFAGQWRRWQRLVMPRLAGKRVLEIGCGPGNLLIDMAQSGYTCSAIERSPQMVAAARARLRRYHLEGQVSLQQGVAQKLPYAAATFDSVVSTFPSDYIFDPLTLDEISRVLGPRGSLVVILGAALLPANFLLLPLVALQSLVYGGQRSRDGQRGYADSSEIAGAGEVTEEKTNEKAAVTVTIMGPQGAVLLRGLQAAGLVASIELVRGPFWEALVFIGRKRE
ncbi:MAG: class I SAM-dependent methyltransferase [Ktedonobacterales bacterium]